MVSQHQPFELPQDKRQVDAILPLPRQAELGQVTDAHRQPVLVGMAAVAVMTYTPPPAS